MSYRFKNPSQVPPGGIQFEQREIGWVAPFPLSENVAVLAARVRQLRLNNPVLSRLQLPTDIRTIKAEIIEYNCVRNPKVCIDTEARAIAMSQQAVIPNFPQAKGCCGA